MADPSRDIESELSLLHSKIGQKPKVNAMDRLQSIHTSLHTDFIRRMKEIPLGTTDFSSYTKDARQCDLVNTLIEIIGGLHERIARLEEEKSAR